MKPKIFLIGLFILISIGFSTYGYSAMLIIERESQSIESSSIVINNNPLLRLLTKETERKNKYSKEIQVRPLRVISNSQVKSGSYYGTVIYHCIYSNPFERGVLENTIDISGNIRKTFLSRNYRISGIEKMYKECENRSVNNYKK